MKSQKIEFLHPIKRWQPTKTEKAELLIAFPPNDPGDTPLNDRVIIQLRSPKTETKGGLYLTQQDADAQLWNEHVGKVIAIGPMAFHFQKDGTPWPGGPWYKIGDYVRIPSCRTDRWSVQDSHYIVVRSYEVLNLIHGSPLDIRNKSVGV